MDVNATRFEEVYERYADLLYRLAFAELLNQADAEDAVSDAFERYLTHAPAFSTREQERAWLVRVTVNRCRDLYRRRKLRTHASLDEADALAAPSEDLSALFLALSELPIRLREAVTLHYLEGFSVDEVGRLLHCSPSAVKMRLARAREQLKPKLKGEDGRV